MTSLWLHLGVALLLHNLKIFFTFFCRLQNCTLTELFRLFYFWMIYFVVAASVVCSFADEGELSFLNSLIAFARQMSGLKLSEAEFALFSALVLLNPSKLLPLSIQLACSLLATTLLSVEYIC